MLPMVEVCMNFLTSCQSFSAQWQELIMMKTKHVRGSYPTICEMSWTSMEDIQNLFQ